MSKSLYRLASKLENKYANEGRKSPENVLKWKRSFNEFVAHQAGFKGITTNKDWFVFLGNNNMFAGDLKKVAPDLEDFLDSLPNGVDFVPEEDGWKIVYDNDVYVSAWDMPFDSRASKKIAQQTAPAPVVPAAANTNYVGFMDAYQKLLTNSVSGLGQANVSKVLEIVMPYKTNAAATSPENAQAVVKAVAAQLNDVQANLNALKQFANSILASS